MTPSRVVRCGDTHTAHTAGRFVKRRAVCQMPPARAAVAGGEQRAGSAISVTPVDWCVVQSAQAVTCQEAWPFFINALNIRVSLIPANI